jgi:hypothetical protein
VEGGDGVQEAGPEGAGTPGAARRPLRRQAEGGERERRLQVRILSRRQHDGDGGCGHAPGAGDGRQQRIAVAHLADAAAAGDHVHRAGDGGHDPEALGRLLGHLAGVLVSHRLHPPHGPPAQQGPDLAPVAAQDRDWKLGQQVERPFRPEGGGTGSHRVQDDGDAVFGRRPARRQHGLQGGAGGGAQVEHQGPGGGGHLRHLLASGGHHR